MLRRVFFIAFAMCFALLAVSAQMTPDVRPAGKQPVRPADYGQFENL